MKLLLLRRRECGYSERAERFLRLVFEEVVAVQSEGPGDTIGPKLLAWDFDVVFAFRSHIIVRADVLKKAKIALNFHPGPPERPGTGCVNFALLADDERYGSTCHYMDEGIDSGPIVDVRYFNLQPRDDVSSVLARTYDYMLCQLYDVGEAVAAGQMPAPLPIQWTSKATRKKEMDALRELKPDIGEEELSRRIRATSFGSYRPYITLHGRRFYLEP